MFDLLKFQMLRNHTFQVAVFNQVTKEDLAKARPYIVTGTDTEIRDYLLDYYDFLAEDRDTERAHSMDVLIPGYPTIGVFLHSEENPFPEGLVAYALKQWMRRTKAANTKPDSA